MSEGRKRRVGSAVSPSWLGWAHHQALAGGRFKSLRLLLALYPFVICLGFFVVAIGFYSVMFGLDFSNVGTCRGRLRDLPGSDFRPAALLV